eukprot:SAG11_NODE_229_length_11945_cov_77.865187_5_plen_116_part_00
MLQGGARLWDADSSFGVCVLGYQHYTQFLRKACADAVMLTAPPFAQTIMYFPARVALVAPAIMYSVVAPAIMYSCSFHCSSKSCTRVVFKSITQKWCNGALFKIASVSAKLRNRD